MFKAKELHGLFGSFNRLFNIDNLLAMARYINKLTKEINRLEDQVEYLTDVVEGMKKNDAGTA